MLTMTSFFFVSWKIILKLYKSLWWSIRAAHGGKADSFSLTQTRQHQSASLISLKGTNRKLRLNEEACEIFVCSRFSQRFVLKSWCKSKWHSDLNWPVATVCSWSSCPDRSREEFCHPCARSGSFCSGFDPKAIMQRIPGDKNWNLKICKAVN